MGKTSIEWCDHSVSPIRARCKETGKVFHFCAHCYAATMAQRFGLPDYVKANRDKVEFFLDEKKLLDVLRRQKPTRFFWEDCSDLFGDWALDEWIGRCLAVMALTPHHTHQVLTKRPERMRRFIGAPNVAEIVDHLAFEFSHEHCCGGLYDQVPEAWPLRNVWLGVSVEDQRRADERIPLLLQVPAAVRFLSCEPLLGEVDLSKWCRYSCRHCAATMTNMPPGFGEAPLVPPSPSTWGWVCSKLHFDWAPPGIHWVIVGGESGPGARPCNYYWLKSLVDQCRAATVPVFVKQWGSRPFYDSTGGARYDDHTYHKLTHKKGGDPAEWPDDLRVREFPTVAT